MTDETEGAANRQRPDDGESMADVNHDAPDGTDPNEVWARGRAVGSPDQ
jgi:hypothetical protein